MANTKITINQQALAMATANGYEDNLFNNNTLNKYTKNFFLAMARGSLALWDVAESLSVIDTAIADGTFTDTDPEITSFSAYCEKVGIDRSNYTKYIKAYREYSELKNAGFSIGVAVAILGTDIAASDFIEKFPPVEMSVRKAHEYAKQYKANMLEVSDDPETEDPEIIEPETETPEDDSESLDGNIEEVPTTKTGYLFDENSLNSFLHLVAEYALFHGTDDPDIIRDTVEIEQIIEKSATALTF